MSEYQPIPVKVAGDIGEKFSKLVVVILAWDQSYSQIHTTTWGKSAEDKDFAAEIGPKIVFAVGGLTELAKYSEDFRNPSQAAKVAAALADSVAALNEALPVITKIAETMICPPENWWMKLRDQIAGAIAKAKAASSSDC